MTNLLNPKAAVFFIARLPQFIAARDPFLLIAVLLTAIASAANLRSGARLSWLAARAGETLRRPTFHRGIDRCVGAVLIGIGVRVAFEQ